MKRGEALFTLHTALQKLYDLFYKEDGSGVTSGLQTYLKEWNIPYANYVCKALKDNGVVKSIGKRDPLTFYNLPIMISVEEVRRIYDEALVAAGRARGTFEEVKIEEPVQNQDSAVIVARIHRKSEAVENKISELEGHIDFNNEEIARMQEKIKQLSELSTAHEASKEKLLHTALIYKDLLS